jgi:cullin 3
MPGSGLDNMIDLQQYDDLARLYTLFQLVPTGVPTLKKALKDSIAERGRLVNEVETSGGDSERPPTLVNHEGDGEGLGVDASPLSKSVKGKGKERAAPVPQTKRMLDAALKWVQDVLDLKDIFDRLLKGCFRDDKNVQIAMNEVWLVTLAPLLPHLDTQQRTQAFESFINLSPKAPEFISLFIDENLKKGLKGVGRLWSDITLGIIMLTRLNEKKTDDEVDIVLDKTITVFRFVTEKDVFERYYKSHLAKRLLQGRSVSDDAEKGMLAKLKVECGFQFTQKLEGMFHDMKISNDTMEAYKKHLATGIVVRALTL